MNNIGADSGKSPATLAVPLATLCCTRSLRRMMLRSQIDTNALGQSSLR
jgi:hypothetical protein